MRSTRAMDRKCRNSNDETWSTYSPSVGTTLYVCHQGGKKPYHICKTALEVYRHCLTIQWTQSIRKDHSLLTMTKPKSDSGASKAIPLSGFATHARLTLACFEARGFFWLPGGTAGAGAAPRRRQSTPAIVNYLLHSELLS